MVTYFCHITFSDSRHKNYEVPFCTKTIQFRRNRKCLETQRRFSSPGSWWGMSGRTMTYNSWLKGSWKCQDKAALCATISAEFGICSALVSLKFSLGKEGVRFLCLVFLEGCEKGRLREKTTAPCAQHKLPGGVCILCLLLHWGPFLQTKKTPIKLILSSHKHDMKVIFSVFISHTLETFFSVWP